MTTVASSEAETWQRLHAELRVDELRFAARAEDLGPEELLRDVRRHLEPMIGLAGRSGEWTLADQTTVFAELMRARYGLEHVMRLEHELPPLAGGLGARQAAAHLDIALEVSRNGHARIGATESLLRASGVVQDLLHGISSLHLRP